MLRCFDCNTQQRCGKGRLSKGQRAARRQPVRDEAFGAPPFSGWFLAHSEHQLGLAPLENMGTLAYRLWTFSKAVSLQNPI